MTESPHIIKGSAEIWHRDVGLSAPSNLMEVRKWQYVPACRPMGIGEFDSPYEFMEWVYAKRLKFNGVDVRKIRRYDILNFSLFEPVDRGFALMLVDPENDGHLFYEGARVQFDKDSQCPYALLPLEQFMGSIWAD